MQRSLWRGSVAGMLLVMGVVVPVAWVCTAAPAHAAQLERLKIAVAPWAGTPTSLGCRAAAVSSISGQRWSISSVLTATPERTSPSSPRSGTWRPMVRTGRSGCARCEVPRELGEFTAKDVRHAVFLISQPESVQTDAGFWRPLMGIGKADSVEEVARKVEQGVEIIDDYKVVFHLTQAAPEFVENISANTDLVMESKARWDAGARNCTGRRSWARAPSSLSSAKSARTSSTNGSTTTGARSRSTRN